MTFEEKIEKAIESSEHKATDFAINYMSKDENNNEGFRRGADWARQETLAELAAGQERMQREIDELTSANLMLRDRLREVMPSLKFLLHCVSQTPWIAEGPGDITNPMFLGTGSVDGDQEVHGKYINAKELLEKLEAEREG